jgi:acetyl-CoA synthetase
MSDVYNPPTGLQSRSNCGTMEEYQRRYKESIDDPFLFWSQIAKEFHWKVEPTKDGFLDYNFNVNDGPIKIEWMKGAKLNICYNTLDR